MSHFDFETTPLPSRLRDGLERIGAALRSEHWSATSAVGLNPTQAHVLAFLAGRDRVGIRVKDIAEQLGVSQPTATDSILALERKKLIRKSSSSEDARSTVVSITAQGRDLLRAIGLSHSATAEALNDLSAGEQAKLLQLLIKLIRSLQQSGAIPVQRMCVTCKHFRPNFYSDAMKPHHCAFVNAAFGDPNLRLDCNDHEPADPATQAATWSAFTGSATLQATTIE
jgi:DNA-binding MarR family transcriptional regulator